MKIRRDLFGRLVLCAADEIDLGKNVGQAVYIQNRVPVRVSLIVPVKCLEVLENGRIGMQVKRLFQLF